MKFEQEITIGLLYLLGVCMMVISIAGMFIDWTFSGGAFRVAVVGFAFYHVAKYYQRKWSKE